MKRYSRSSFLSNLRGSRGLTQRQLAEKIQVDPISVSRWERGIVEPTAINRVRIAAVLGCHPNELMNGAEA